MIESDFKILQPRAWAAPKGYVNGIVAEGRYVFIAGQIGWNAQAKLVSHDFVAQVEQALSNIVEILREAGGGPHQLVRLKWYLTSKSEYTTRQKEIGETYRRVVGRHFPAMTVVVVRALLEEGAKVEIEATAIIPSTTIAP